MKAMLNLPCSEPWGLENIQLILVPAQKMYEGYLNEARSRTSFLKAILETL